MFTVRNSNKCMRVVSIFVGVNTKIEKSIFFWICRRQYQQPIVVRHVSRPSTAFNDGDPAWPPSTKRRRLHSSPSVICKSVSFRKQNTKGGDDKRREEHIRTSDTGSSCVSLSDLVKSKTIKNQTTITLLIRFLKFYYYAGRRGRRWKNNYHFANDFPILKYPWTR